MGFIFPKRITEIILVLVIVLLVVFFASPRYTSQYLHRPSGHVFVGMTAYFEDFYVYLDQFYQGKTGNWLTENRFSIERFPPTPIYFTNILMGKIGGLFGLESYQSYNFFAISLKFIFIILSYVLITQFFPKSIYSRIITFFIFTFSTSFPNISIIYGKFSLNPPIDVFRTANRILARFGTSPNDMLINSLSVIFLIFMIRIFIRENNGVEDAKTANKQILQPSVSIRKAAILVILFLFICLIDLYVALILLTTFVILLYFRKIRIFPIPNNINFKTILLSLGLLFAVVGGYLYFVVNNNTVYRNANTWDVGQYLAQIKSLGLIKFILGFGLQLPLFLYGLRIYIKKQNKSVYEHVAVIFVSLCWIGYIVPLVFRIPILGFRFLYSVTYVFMAVLVLAGIRKISIRFHSMYVYLFLIGVYYLVNLIAFIPGWRTEFKPLKEPDYHFAYIPNNIYKGLMYLRNKYPKVGNILASPNTSVDLMIPGFTGWYTYTGHFLTTYNSDQKDTYAIKFFNSWTDRPTTHDFLKQNKIKYIFSTTYSGQINNLKTYYPFLKVAYENPMVTIFEYQNN